MVSTKHIEFNINDENAGKIAEVIGNKTCKRILNILAEEKELSENDISRKLGIPINTAEYNLRKLVDSGLVEKTASFFWSVKGKKIPTYRIANKRIVISTKTSFAGLLGSAVLGGLVLGGIKLFENYNAIKSRALVQYAADKSLETAITAPVASSNTGGVAGSFISSISYSQDLWIWVLGGVALGLTIFFIFKKARKNLVKGGLKL